ncbi:MAG: hypothetical protein LC797_17995 [Chloroflexi bacterium]|nr:hypothetical protein [Chloroflexota bacterium]
MHEAAQLLGVSLNTVRRKIARGELKAQRAIRPQGHIWQVFLPFTQDAAPPSSQPPAGTMQQHAGAEQLVSVLAPLVEAAVAPLRAELADVRSLLSSRDQKLGRLHAEVERLQVDALEIGLRRESDAVMTEPPNTPPRAEQARERPWWRFW